MGREGAVILRTGTLCCAQHRLAPYAVHSTDGHLMLFTAQTGTLCCSQHRLTPYAVHSTYWHLMLCTAQTGTLCCAQHRLAPYAVHSTDCHLMMCTTQTGTLCCAQHRLSRLTCMHVQGYQLRRQFPSLYSAIPVNVRADCQSADAVPFQML